MRLIDPHAWDCHPCGDGFVFRGILRARGERERFFLHDRGSTHEIAEDTFLVAKFGHAYKLILPSFRTEPDAVSRSASGAVAACHFAESTIRIFSPDGHLTAELGPGESGRGGHLLYGVALSDRGVWAAFPTDNTVLLYLMDGTEASMVSSIFSYPEGLAVRDNLLFVCDMGNNRICELNQLTAEVTEVYAFDESVWEFVPAASGDIVVLESGVYRLSPGAA